MCNRFTLNRTNRSRAYTLLELIMTVSFLMVTVSMAAPNLNQFVARGKLLSESSTLEESLRLARSIALAKQATVVICPLTQSDTCNTRVKANQNWQYGWQSFIDTNSNRRFDSADVLIKKHSPNKKVSVVFNQNGILRFFPNGSARSAGFYLCMNGQETVKHLRILHSGRARQNRTISEKHDSICRATL